jgi:hypothetical protein
MASYRRDFRASFARWKISGKHRVEQLLHRGPEMPRDVIEVQDQQQAALGDDCWSQPPDVIFKARGLFQKDVGAQRSTGEDELQIKRM